MVYKYERKINYYELDGMNIVHHSNYIRYMEEARVEFLTWAKIPYDKIEASGIMIPVLGVNLKYKYPAKFGDTIVIEVKIAKFDGIKLEMEYVIKNKENDKLLVQGKTNHCFTNSNMRPISIKKQDKHLYDVFEKMMED